MMVAKFITTAVIQHHECDEAVKLDRIVPDADRGIGITGWTPGIHLQCKLPNGSWRCKRCLAVSCNKLLAKGCGQSWQENGHMVYSCGDFFFCIRCACFSKLRMQGLGRACRGTMGKSDARRRQLRRLMQGHDPYTDKPLGNVHPLSGTMFQHGMEASASHIQI